jgi:protein-L-isoaspartate(D-aspartate) O-methyltransferase
VTGTSAERLHEDLVGTLLAAGLAWREPVQQAMRAVPRHLFLPEVPPAEAYAAGKAVVTKRDPCGAPLSSASAPGVVAMMLDQLDVHPGHRVLEIGSGTGYNAALLVELAGPDGQVVTVDVDPDCTARTREALARTGHTADVRTGDGALGTGDGSEFDRIIVTAGAWDVPPAWFDQLRPGGRLVVPLRWRRQSQSVAFVREPGRLRSDGLGPAGFIPMATPDGERRGSIGRLGDDAPVILLWDRDQPVDVDALTGVLDRPAVGVWPRVTVHRAVPTHGVWLRLTTDPRACWILSTALLPTPDGGPGLRVRGPALVEGPSLAFLTFRPHDRGHLELGAVGFGPSGATLAQAIAHHIRAWDGARDVLPRLTAHPVGTPDHEVPAGTVIDKHYARLVVSYPPALRPAAARG